MDPAECSWTIGTYHDGPLLNESGVCDCDLAIETFWLKYIHINIASSPPSPMAATNGANGTTATKGDHKMIPRPSPIALAHVVLRSSPANYQPMIRFYLELLNAEIILEEATFAFLRYDDEHHRVGILMTPDTRPKSGEDVAGLEHLSFTFATLTEMARVYQHLRSSLGVEPYWAVNHGMTSSMYYRDPDRNKVEIQIENFDSPQEADAFVRGPLFTANPVGTDIDPPSWAERILAKMGPEGGEGLSGVEIRDIKTRREIGPRHEIPWVALAP